MAHGPSDTRTIADIEVLRGVAVLFTLYHHRPDLLPWLSRDGDQWLKFAGGVDLFLVVSGFVIARGLLAQWRESPGGLDFVAVLLAFWIRRVWRIWPTALVWLGAVAIMSILIPGQLWGHFYSNIPLFVAIIGGVENIHAWYCDYGEGLRGSNALAHYWSLSLEEQFYLLFPLALLLVNRRWLPWLLAGGIVAQVLLPRAQAWHLGFVLRSDALLLGVALAASLAWPGLRDMLEPRFLLALRWPRWPVTGLLLLLNAGFDAGHVVPFSLGALALVCAVLVHLASYDRDYVWPPGAAKRALVWLGGRSYAIYVVHVPCFYVVREAWAHAAPASAAGDRRFALPLILTATVVILVVAELNWRLLETPLRRHGAGLARAFLARHRARLASATETNLVAVSATH